MLTQAGNRRMGWAESFVAADDAYSVGAVDSAEIPKSAGFQQQAVERLLQWPLHFVNATQIRNYGAMC